MTTTALIRSTLAATVLGLLLAACGSSGGSQPADVNADTDAEAEATVESAQVTIADSRFGPTEIVVGAGATVSFQNTDPFAHTVTAADDSPLAFDSGNLDQDAQFEISFDEPGSYAYFCQIHPTMRATVVVE